MKDNNKGLSLVELIVVIAILGILVGVVGVSVTWISRQKVINASKDTKQELQLARAYARSKGFCKLTIKGKDDNNPSETKNTYIYIYTAASDLDLLDPSKCKYGDGPATIYKRHVTTKVYYEDGKVVTVSEPEDYCDINFNRTLGGYEPSNYSGHDDNGILVTGKSVPIMIEYTNGQKKSTIVLAKYTGTATIK